MIPLIKFVSNEKIMGQFAVSKYNTYFATCFGIFLFSLNFRVVFFDLKENISWWQPLLLIVYLVFIVKVISEPVRDLEEMSMEELEDHEYNRLEVDDDGQVNENE